MGKSEWGRVHARELSMFIALGNSWRWFRWCETGPLRLVRLVSSCPILPQEKQSNAESSRNRCGPHQIARYPARLFPASPRANLHSRTSARFPLPDSEACLLLWPCFPIVLQKKSNHLGIIVANLRARQT